MRKPARKCRGRTSSRHSSTKGHYVVLEAEDLKSAAPESHDRSTSGVHRGRFDRAGLLQKPLSCAGQKAEKGYVLLRETLRRPGRIGIGRVVIRTREYLCAVFPQGDALVMNLLRYPQEVVDLENYNLPSAKAAGAKISKAELDMAEKLIESMSAEWKPGDFRDEFRERLSKVIEKRMKAKGVTQTIEEAPEEIEDATTNVVDFMSLLRKSLASKKRTPARAAVKKGVAAVKKAPARKSAGKRKPDTHAKTKTARKRA